MKMRKFLLAALGAGLILSVQPVLGEDMGRRQEERNQRERAAAGRKHHNQHERAQQKQRAYARCLANAANLSGGAALCKEYR